MNLPTQDQVNTGVRYATAVAGVVVGLFGLAGHVDMNNVTEGIKSLGLVVSSIVTFIGFATPVYMAIKGMIATSEKNRAIALAKSNPDNKIITSPEIAAATPSIPNIVSSTEMKVVPK